MQRDRYGNNRIYYRDSSPKTGGYKDTYTGARQTNPGGNVTTSVHYPTDTHVTADPEPGSNTGMA